MLAGEGCRQSERCLSLDVATTSRPCLVDPRLVRLGDSVHHTGNTAHPDGRDVAEVGGVVKEEDTGRGNGQPYDQPSSLCATLSLLSSPAEAGTPTAESSQNDQTHLVRAPTME